MRLVDIWMAEWWRVRRLFDAAFYLQRYPDVRRAGMNPLWHYLRHGAAEGRKPHRLFEPDYYLSCCPEARSSTNPLLHFIQTGGRLGSPHPLFDCHAYLEAHPDVARRGVNPLLHYVRQKKATRDDWQAKAPAPQEANVGQTLSSVNPPVSLEILDVAVDIAFWETADGRMSFIAEPQQRPFFRAMRFDQLSAQLDP
jgi:hypothetical protein